MADLESTSPDKLPEATPDETGAVDLDAEGQERPFGEDDDAATGIPKGIEPEALRNYASDPDVVDKLTKEILHNLRIARDNREAKIEQDWIRYRDIYNLRRVVAYYEGRSKLFIPAVRKAIDTLVRVAKDAIFSDPYLGIESDVPEYKEKAMDLMRWMLEDQAKIRDKMSAFLRQLYQLGTSCFKVSWRKSQRTIKYREYDPDIGRSTIKTKLEHDYYGPKISVVDMRHVYVWPETEVDYDGLRIVFEDSTIKISELEDKVADGLYDAVAVSTAIKRRSTGRETQLLSQSQANREGMGEVTKVPEDMIDITYGWGKFKLPGQDEAHWNQFVILNNNIQDVIRVAENHWWFQKPNYLFGTLFQEHDYFYGHGITEMVEMWQYMVNDIANQTMDCGTFTLNPITTYDPGLIDDPDLLEIQPMAKWPIHPKAVNIIRPPVELAQQGINMLQFLMNVIQESSDATALVQGAPRVGLGRATGTATGVSQLFAASNAAIIDQVDSLEYQVLTPMAHYVEIMAHEFMDDDMIVRKVGPDGVVLTQRVIRPQDLMLSTDVRWIASNRLREKAAKIQQLINFFNIAAQIPPEFMAQQGFQLAYKEIIKDIYSGLGLPNVDRIVIDLMKSLPGIPPEFEESLIAAGKQVLASSFDVPENHQAHLQAHFAFRPRSELERIRMQEHIASHYQAIQQAQARAQAMAGQPGAEQGGARPQEQPQGAEEDIMKGVLSMAGEGTPQPTGGAGGLGGLGGVSGE